jgi:Protein of unknown function (DUF3761)
MFIRVATLIAAATAAAAIGSAAPATGPSAPLAPGPFRAECEPGYYENSNGVCVPDPGHNIPGPHTAICRDGTYSDSQHCTGTCSHHGGVQEWLVPGC